MANPDTRPLAMGRGMIAAAGATAADTVSAAASVAKSLGSRYLGGVPGDAKPHNRWLAVTINCSPARLSRDNLPEPVARLTDRAEVSIRPAPGGRGTELAMRLLHPPPTGVTGMAARFSGEDPRQRLRSALRDAKSLIETGEVIHPDTPPTTHATLAGKLMDFAISTSAGEGRL
jgi:hypothetical protein